jgi:fructose-1,6-bisphosphatase/inositol monophosphatase family enzyme
MREQKISTVLERIGALLETTPFSHSVSWQKGDSTIVTDLDVRLQEEMVAIISEQCPSHNLIYEEGDRQFIDNGSPFTWVIDPIDGTANFAAGKREYGSSVGVMKGDAFIAALVAFPAFGETYTGSVDGGLKRNGSSYSSAGVTAATEEVVLCSRSFPLLKETFAQKGYEPRFYYCATYSLLRVLKGEASMFLALNTNLYDVGPMALLLKLAGCECLGRNGGPLPFAPRPDKIPFFLAVNSPEKAREFLAIIGEKLNGT